MPQLVIYFGDPSGLKTILPDGIASTLAFGSPTVSHADTTVSPDAIASTLAFGSPTVTPGAVTFNPTGLASTLAFGSPTIASISDVNPTGIASTLAFGLPVVSHADATIIPTGISSTLGFGSPTITPTSEIILTGIASTLGIGEPDILAINEVLPSGLASTFAFGSPLFSTINEIFPKGRPTNIRFGNANVALMSYVLPTGVASTIQFGTLSTYQYQEIRPKAIAPTTRFGRFEAIYIEKPDTLPISVQEAVFEDSVLKLTLKETRRGDDINDLLQKFANHVKLEVVLDAMPGAVQVTREGFVEEFFGKYAIKETGSGLLVGLFKSVGGVMKPISPGIINEIRILQGQKGIEMIPPKGWEIIDDVDIQARYNVGMSPNFVAVAIRYIGI